MALWVAAATLASDLLFIQASAIGSEVNRAARWRVIMAQDWNENTYAQQFDGSLRRSPKSRPVAVTTNLRMMNEATAHEVRMYAQRAPGAPRYVLDPGEDLPLHPSLRALGRHYFTW
jgi:hypothetical protein